MQCTLHKYRDGVCMFTAVSQHLPCKYFELVMNSTNCGFRVSSWRESLWWCVCLLQTPSSLVPSVAKWWVGLPGTCPLTGWLSRFLKSPKCFQSLFRKAWPFHDSLGKPQSNRFVVARVRPLFRHLDASFFACDFSLDSSMCLVSLDPDNYPVY